MSQFPNEPRLTPPAVDQRYGLGDAVHTAAQPVVMLVKYFGGPNLNQCGGCASRRKFLNKAIPDLRHPLSHATLPINPPVKPTNDY